MNQNGPNNSDGAPYQYSNNINDWGDYSRNPNSIPRCTLVPTTVSGKLSFSTQSPSTDKACVANTHNAGNWYNYPAAAAGSDMTSEPSYPSDVKNSICPKGWQLPPNAGNKSYYNLIHDKYLITDTNLLSNSVMSFVRLGYYDYNSGSLIGRGNNGRCWSSTAGSATSSYNLRFDSGSLLPQTNVNRAYGFSIRCVSR